MKTKTMVIEIIALLSVIMFITCSTEHNIERDKKPNLEQFTEQLLQASLNNHQSEFNRLCEAQPYYLERATIRILDLYNEEYYKGDSAKAEQKLTTAQSTASKYVDIYQRKNLFPIIQTYQKWTPNERKIKIKADSLLNHGTELHQKRDYLNASDAFNRSLALFRQIHDSSGLGKSLTEIGNTYLDMDEYQQAIQFTNKAIELHNKIGLKTNLGANYNNIGVLYTNIGDFDNAIHYLNLGLTIAKEIKWTYLQGNCLNSLGNIYDNKGDYSKTLGYYLSALKLYEQDNLLYQQGAVTGNLANFYVEIGEYDRAVDFFYDALKIFQQIDHKIGQGVTYANLGDVYIRSKKLDLALENLNQGLSLAQTINSKLLEGYTLGKIGYIHHLGGEYEPAQRYYQQALDLHKNMGRKEEEGYTLTKMGEMYLEMNELVQAEKFINDGSKVFSDIGDMSNLWFALFIKGKLMQQKKELKQALQYYQQSIDIIENMRGTLSGRGQSEQFYIDKLDVYNAIINLYYELHISDPEAGYDRQAFFYAERIRARALLDLLAETKIDIKTGVDSMLLAREQNLLDQITSVQNQLIESKNKISSKQKLKVLEREFDLLQKEMRQFNSKYAELKYPSTLNVNDVQNQVIDDQTVLLEFHLGNPNSYLFVITKNSFQIVKLASQHVIEQKVRAYRTVISKRPGQRPFFKTSYQLFTTLFPLNEITLPANAHLLIIPDGILYYLPYEALVTELPNTGEKNIFFLIKSHEISYTPSASVLNFIKSTIAKASPPDEFLAFGDPILKQKRNKSREEIGEQISRAFYEDFDFEPLKYSGAEIKNIAQLYPPGKSKIYLREAAKEEQLKKGGLKQFDKIHFSTHGIMDEVVPGRSGLIFTMDRDPTEDGILQMNEIFNLKFDADLVVLSACQTGLGKLVRGEGMIGLTRAFFYAGTASLVVSLWQVDDKSTAELMVKFYQNLESGLHKNDALRKAKLELLSQETAVRHPYYWAPFILIGEAN